MPEPENEEVPAEEEAGEEEAVEEEAPAVVRAAGVKPKSDIWTLLLILTFIAQLVAIILAGIELHEFYDVTFWIFTKQ